jgi:hypothetical protein
VHKFQDGRTYPLVVGCLVDEINGCTVYAGVSVSWLADILIAHWSTTKLTNALRLSGVI